MPITTHGFVWHLDHAQKVDTQMMSVKVVSLHVQMELTQMTPQNIVKLVAQALTSLTLELTNVFKLVKLRIYMLMSIQVINVFLYVIKLD